jgi:hypothetical protein
LVPQKTPLQLVMQNQSKMAPINQGRQLIKS